MPTMGAKPVLYDMPVSNNGARCRIIIYKKGIEDKIDVKSPMDIGGLRSPEYLALNPQVAPSFTHSCCDSPCDLAHALSQSLSLLTHRGKCRC